MSHVDALSTPERGCARLQARRVRQRVQEDGGCCYCLHRDRTFAVGRLFACGLSPPKAFPKCLGASQGFEFDEPAFREAVKHG